MNKVFIKKVLRMVSFVCLLPAATGCLDGTVQEYGPTTLALDDKNELHISTLPAGFSDTEAHIPYLYKAVRTPSEVNFQLFVREKGKEMGPNPHVETINIESFSYRFPGQAPIELINNYNDNFWMQGNPDYDTSDISPVTYNEAGHLQINVKLSLNGQDYEFEEKLEAASRRYVLPLLLYAL